MAREQEHPLTSNDAIAEAVKEIKGAREQRTIEINRESLQLLGEFIDEQLRRCTQGKQRKQ